MRIVLISIFLLQSIYAQQKLFDEKQFFMDLHNSYYTVKQTGISNFVALVNNVSTENFAKKHWNNRDIFPIQIIWLNNDRLFLSQQGTPALPDSLTPVYSSLLDDLKEQLRGLLFDYKRFFISGLYSTIPQDYSITKSNDLIQIKFNALENGDTISYGYYFGLNGLCLKVETLNYTQKQRIETYPRFKIVKTKWLCTGWEVQISVNGKIESGFNVTLNNNLIDQVWVPGDIVLSVQSIDKPGVTFNDVIKFRNYLFNQSLQFIDTN